MNTKSVNTVEWKKYTGKEEAREGGGGGGRWWQEAIRNSRQKQPTSKSLSNLIGVIESFRLHRHWADEVNTAMKSALTSPPHPNNDVCNHISSYWTLWAWWRQMFGLVMGEHRTNRLSFYLWDEGDVYKWNAGYNWFREFNHFSDLLSIRSPIWHLPNVLHTNTLKFWNLTLKRHLEELQKTWSPVRDWNHSHLLFWYKT